MMHRVQNTLLEQRTRMAMILLLVAGVFVVYSSAFGHTFLFSWDDTKYILNNSAVKGLTLEHLRMAFTSYFVGNYAPVQIVSYMLDYELWGMRPAGFIGTNLLLHSLNGVLVFLLIERLCVKRLVAFGAAYIFLFHPVQVESVAWMSERKTLLAMFFFLIAFSNYCRYRETGGAGIYLCSLAAFVLALLSKSVAVILPIVLLLYDICYAAEGDRLRLKDKISFFAFSLVAGLLAIISQTPATNMSGGIRDYPGGTLLTTFYTMVPVLTEYLSDCFSPHALSPYYMTPIRIFPDGNVLLSSLLMVLLAVQGMVLYRSNRQHFFWYALFFVGLLPASQIVPILTLKNDRYLYFPLLGLAPFVMLFLDSAIRRLSRWRCSAWGVIAVMLCALPVLSFQQARIWRDSITLWTYAVQLDPKNQIGWLMLSKTYTKQGNGRAAVEALDRLNELKEQYGPVRGWK